MKELRKIIELQKGDITKLSVDAIVNAANSLLLGGGGVDGAIHRAGGPMILKACKEIRLTHGECEVGQAVITTSGLLPSKFVIHTVGPIWNRGGQHEEIKLANCYSNSLQLAVDNNCRTIAFPNISTGVYRFPKDLAAKIAVKTVLNFITAFDHFEKVIFICFDEENFNYIQNELSIPK